MRSLLKPFVLNHGVENLLSLLSFYYRYYLERHHSGLLNKRKKSFLIVHKNMQLAVETYTSNQVDHTNTPKIISGNKTKRHTTTHESTNQSKKATTTRNLAENLRLRIKPKNASKHRNETKNQFCCSQNSKCCGLLKSTKIGRFCQNLCNCVTSTMGNQDKVNIPEPLVTNTHVDRRRVCINISGKKYETRESTLQKCPDTLLSLPQRELFFDSLNGEYFFDRNRKAFGAILTYCQTGMLVKPANLDDRIFAAELRFFGFETESEALNKQQNPINEAEMLLPKNKILKKLWQLFEFPDTSFVARIVSLFSMSVILLSIVMFCIETLPEFKEQTYTIHYNADNSTRKELKGFKTKDVYQPVFATTEAACIAWFTFEYCARLIASPRKFQFIWQPLNLIDLIAIIPFYIMLVLKQTNTNVSSLSILRVLRLVRVFRIFKLSRYSKGLKILGYTFRVSCLFFISLRHVFTQILSLVHHGLGFTFSYSCKGSL